MERKGFIGSSDCPVIMGDSPWRTPYQLWEEKMGIGEPFEGNWATERGNRLEPIARAHYELINSITMDPLKVCHKDYPFLQAALDGANLDHKLLLEIKCPGKEDYLRAAIEKKVPKKYEAQIQFQLLVTGFQVAHYFTFYKGKEGPEETVLIEVKADYEYMEKLLKACLLFWDYVETKTPPPLSEKDYKKIKDKELTILILDWKTANKQLKEVKTVEDALRRQIIEKLPHKRCFGSGVYIRESRRKGSVDYGRIAELQGLNLEPYRKPDTISFLFDMEKE